VYKKGLPIVVIIYLSVLLVGCLATRDDIRTSTEQLQYTQASLYAEMQALTKNMQSLCEKLDESKRQIAMLNQRIDDINATLTEELKSIKMRLPQPIAKSTEQELTPTELYQIAYRDYLSGRYDLAILGFENFIRKYPNATLTPQAEYYLAESYFAKKDLYKAVERFSVFIKKYPESDSVPAAYFKQSCAFKELGYTEKAIEILNIILSNYPNSQEAELAKGKIREWSIEKSSPTEIDKIESGSKN